MEPFIEILRQYPAVALFLTVGIGFLLGKIKYKSFSLGSVTAVLLVGVLVGQLDIKMSGPMKMFFFMMFLFSIGYSVGPQFFRSLKGAGLKQVLFAVLMSSTCFGITILLAKVFAYTSGETVGLFSGSQTCSALMGVGSEMISKMGGDPEMVSRELSIVPVCYAVTYIFGTLGTVIILGNIGPKLLGGLEKVKKDTQALAVKLNESSWKNDPACVNAFRAVPYRAYKVSNPFFIGGKTVAQTEAYLLEHGLALHVDRVRRGGTTNIATSEMLISPGDEIVLSGRREFIVDDVVYIGKEISGDDLLAYPVEMIPVLAIRKKAVGRTVSDLMRLPELKGVSIDSIQRKGKDIEPSPSTVIEKNDRLMIVGDHKLVVRASEFLGHMDRPSTSSDLMFVGLAIFIGGVFGALTIVIGEVPISFGTSGGALVAGLVFGWLRTKRPTVGHIPQSALWLMNNLGLNVFVAIIGIEAAPSFVAGIRAVGWMMLVAGMIGTSIPLFVGLWLGHKVFKFHPAITLGCCAGTRTCTASLGAVQDALDSTLPALGYTVTYAVSNILLVIWGMVSVIVIS